MADINKQDGDGDTAIKYAIMGIFDRTEGPFDAMCEMGDVSKLPRGTAPSRC